MGFLTRGWLATLHPKDPECAAQLMRQKERRVMEGGTGRSLGLVSTFLWDGMGALQWKVLVPVRSFVVVGIETGPRLLWLGGLESNVYVRKERCQLNIPKCTDYFSQRGYFSEAYSRPLSMWGFLCLKSSAAWQVFIPWLLPLETPNWHCPSFINMHQAWTVINNWIFEKLWNS